MQNGQSQHQKQQLEDIHRLLDLIECMNLTKAEPWWVVALQQIRFRYAGTDPRDLSQDLLADRRRK